MSLLIYRPLDRSVSKRFGRPPKDEIQRFRILAWYLIVKSRGEWSDYKLDVTFGLPDTQDISENAARPRIFELIRKKGVIPERGNKTRRGFDLIDIVDSHPEFHGTKAIYESPFWELICDTAPTLQTANKFVNKLLKLYGLTRLEIEYDAHLIDSLELPDIDHTHLLEYLHMSAIERYDHRISCVLKILPSDMDRLTLTGALFREAYLGMALKQADILKDRLMDQIDRFFRDGWAKPLRGSFRQPTIKRLVYWAFDPAEKLGEWPDPVDLMLESYIVSSDYSKLREKPDWRDFCLSVRDRKI